MVARVIAGPERIELWLTADGGSERYVGRVEAVDNVPKSVSCRGQGTPGAFPLREGRLKCPEGWIELPAPARQKRPG
ncbi:hypothetical protein [Cyanobium sp. ATX-6F1]